MELTGEPDGPPTKSGLSMVDYSGGLVAAISMLAAVHAARRDGVGADCDVSLYDTAIGLLTYPATWHLNAGFEPVRTHHSAHPSLVPFQAFRASDGWLVVGCAKEKFWQRLAVVIGRPELAVDPRFATFAVRQANAGELIPMLEEIFSTRAVAGWLEPLYAASIPCGPINDVAAALREEHTAARGLIVETEHPVFGTVKQVASPVRVGSAVPDYRRAPRRNEDFDLVMNEIIGWTEDRIARAVAEGAFGDLSVDAAR
jgi:crotonobetainyl-CoA:carnitine CoA-transferase CaiB-like acyl-CoA transferase